MAAPSADDIFEAYLANADYDEVADLAKARAFRTACRRLLALPSESELGNRAGAGTRLKYDRAQVSAELARCNAWIGGQGGGTVVHPDFSSLRD